MRCAHCDGELTEDNVCPRCRQEHDAVRVLTPEERENFRGVTIQNDSTEKNNNYDYENNGSRHRVYVKQVSFGAGKTSLWTKLIIAAILAFFLFVFLPMAVFIAVTISLIWLLFRFLRR